MESSAFATRERGRAWRWKDPHPKAREAIEKNKEAPLFIGGKERVSTEFELYQIPSLIDKFWSIIL